MKYISYLKLKKEEIKMDICDRYNCDMIGIDEWEEELNEEGILLEEAESVFGE